MARCIECLKTLTKTGRGGGIEVTGIVVIDNRIVTSACEFPPECMALVTERACEAADKLEEALAD